MTPMVTLLLCLPAALVFIVCVCGVGVLWPSTAQPAESPTVSRRRGGSAQHEAERKPNHLGREAIGYEDARALGKIL